MKITSIEDIHADGGLKTVSFLKVTTDEGLTGWSEYNEFAGSRGLTGLIRRVAKDMIGKDPRATGHIAATLAAQSRSAAGGLNAQACAAIENACIDIKAKALNVPVCDLFGGAIRERLQVYWSHCGTFRIRDHELFGAPAITSPDDFRLIGKEAAALGVTALKTNIILFGGSKPIMYMPERGSGPGHPERDLPKKVQKAAIEQISAFREGAGPDMGIMLDVVANFRPDGCIRLARTLEPFDLTWLEIDLTDPDALASIRKSTTIPIASLESLYHRRMYRPFLEATAVDVAIVDVMWNGIFESIKIADLADVYDVSVSTHNFASNLSLAMSAHLCAAIPNFRYMEMDFDQPSWSNDLLEGHIIVKDGMLHLPSGPGWGIGVNEEAVKANPPKTPIS